MLQVFHKEQSGIRHRELTLSVADIGTSLSVVKWVQRLRGRSSKWRDGTANGEALLLMSVLGPRSPSGDLP